MRRRAHPARRLAIVTNVDPAVLGPQPGRSEEKAFRVFGMLGASRQ